MTIQTQTNSANLREFVLAFSIADPIQADSHDYGFDFNEDELGRELLAPLPTGITIQPSPEVDAFENTCHYLLY